MAGLNELLTQHMYDVYGVQFYRLLSLFSAFCVIIIPNAIK